MVVTGKSNKHSNGPKELDSVEETVLTWKADIPLITNPVVIRAMFFALVISYLLITGIFAIVLGVDDHMERLPTFMLAMLGAFALVAFLLLLVMLIIFRNQMRVQYLLDDVGLASVVIDRRAELGNSLAILAGTIDKNPGLAGAGLLSSSNQREYTRWDRVSDAKYYPEKQYIKLVASGWWPVGAIFCTDESYEMVEEKVRAILANR